ncbi:MAG: DUF167 domain-containing protein [Chloroflexia bacterium]
MKAIQWLAADTFAVWLKPQARRNRIVGVREGALHVQVAAPPVEGKANQALIALLAEILRVPEGQVILVAGERSRRKVVRVQGIEPEVLQQRLQAALAQV